MRLTAEQIAGGKRRLISKIEVLHEHDDCIRIAYEWLDAQPKLTAPNRRSTRPLKHIIEGWGGRYVSQSDVEVAALLHPDVTGEYPHFNISSRLMQPALRRLDGIGEAGKHPRYREKYKRGSPYSRKEESSDA